jgi:hypothetical protein
VHGHAARLTHEPVILDTCSCFPLAHATFGLFRASCRAPRLSFARSIVMSDIAPMILEPGCAMVIDPLDGELSLVV